jgi:sugar phosphate isomerase/epimerase
MKIDYSISQWNFFHYGTLPRLEQEIARVREMGYGIELWGWWGAERDLYAPESCSRLKPALQGMRVSLHSALVHSFAEQQKQIDAARALGARVLVVHSDEFFLPGSRELDRALCQDVVAYATEQGVQIALENGQLSFLVNALEAVEDLKICLDVGHVYLTTNTMREFLTALKTRIVHLHLQDILTPAELGLPQTGMDHYTPGSGGIPIADWKLLVATLQEIDFEGLAVFEIRPRNPGQTARLGAQFFNALLAAAPKLTTVAPVPLDVGSRRELFVDEYLVDGMQGLALQLQHPRPTETVMVFDQPWEGATCAYFTVFLDGERKRMYYRASPASGAPQFTCYAESDDGVHWTRPALGLYPFNQSRDNNIVWSGEGAHNMAPFIDTNPAAPADQRYKALAGEPPLALVSADGLRWHKLLEAPVLTQGKFDSQNLAFWDAVRGCYVAYFRIFVDGVRSVARSDSPDFVHWSDPRPVCWGDGPKEHLYTSAILPYFRAPHILLGFPARFVPDRQPVTDSLLPGVSDAVFVTSRDGKRFERRFMESFIRPGRERANWTDRNNFVAWGMLPTGTDELSLYVSRHFRHPTAHLQRYVLRTDGFVSLHAPYRGGELLTKPLVFSGDHLRLNFATSAAGSVQVEVQDADGVVVPGYSLQDCSTLVGDHIEGTVRWAGGAELTSLAGRPVRLRLVARDADLYSLRFCPAGH